MINVGLVGAGYWGPNVAKSIELTKKGRIRWLCDLSEKRLQGLSARYPEAKTTTSLSEVLQDNTLQAVCLSTPVNTHFALAKEILEAGKHLFVEKPITDNSEEAIVLTRLAKDKGVKLMVGQVFEYNPSIIALDKLIRSGALGDVQYVSCERTNLGPVRTDVNALWDLATHDISIICKLFDSKPVSVSAKGKVFLNKGVEDVVFSTYLLDDGTLVNMHASWLNPRKVREITVVGSKKMAVWDDLDIKSPLKIYNKSVKIPNPDSGEFTDTFLAYKTTCVDGGVEAPQIEMVPPLQAECEHFLDRIEKDLNPDTDGYSAYRVVRILEATTESLKADGKTVAVAIKPREEVV